MKCPVCDSEGVKAFVHVQLSIDADDNYHLSKKVINKKTTELRSQSHDKTHYACVNCLWVHWPSKDGD